MLMDFETKPGVYAIFTRAVTVLLVYSPEHAQWTLPGGGLDFGEDPVDGVRREVFEETGYHVHVDRLLGAFVNSFPHGLESTTHPVEILRLIYQASILDGELTDEIEGSTSQARWFPIADIPTLDTHPIVIPAFRLFRERPADGRPPTGSLAP